MKGKKLPRYLTPNFIGACEEYCEDTSKKEVRLGDFLNWLKRKKKEVKKMSGRKSIDDAFEIAKKVKDKKLTPKDIEGAVKEKKCPYCGYNTLFNATIEAYRDFYFDEGKIEWCDDVETPGDQGNRSDLAPNPTIICGTCCKKIPKEVWKKWFERSQE